MTTSTSFSVPAELDHAHRRHVLGGEPVIFHCHHYNTFLQRSIQDAAFVHSQGFLIGAAAEVSHNQLSELFAAQAIEGVEARAHAAAEVYRWAGFGTLDLTQVGPDGGIVRSPNSHYAWAWASKFGSTDEKVCLFATGWIAGAVAAIYDRPAGSYAAEETTCGLGSGDCVFEITAGDPNYDVFDPVGLGPLAGGHPSAKGPIDYDGIYGAVTGLPLAGDDAGHIDAFGVFLTHHYANYYNRISFEMLRKAEAQFGVEAKEAIEPLLVEAGHVCAFNTFGGIMKSTEWNALIRPNLESREDWVHGMVAVVNALGWGSWRVETVSEDRAVFRVYDDYESVGHLAMYGQAAHPVAYLALGAAIGTMNLVYVGDIASGPELNEEFYHDLFKRRQVYRGEETVSRAMGGDYSEFVVEKVAD